MVPHPRVYSRGLESGFDMWRETAKEVRAVLEQRLGLVGKK